MCIASGARVPTWMIAWIALLLALPERPGGRGLVKSRMERRAGFDGLEALADGRCAQGNQPRGDQSLGNRRARHG